MGGGESGGAALILKDDTVRLKFRELEYQTGRIFETVCEILRSRGLLRKKREFKVKI